MDVVAFLAMDFHIAVDPDFEKVLLPPGDIVSQGGSVAHHDFRGGPLVDVVQLEPQGVGLYLHHPCDHQRLHHRKCVELYRYSRHQHRE